MESLDIIQLITGTSPTVGIAIYCIYQMRLDRADALRREAAYGEALRQDRQELIALLRENADTNRGLRDQLHELKNVIQKGIFEMDERRNTRSRGATDAR